MLKTAILIASHNRKCKTRNCLLSIYNQSFKANKQITIFLVDDGSTDSTSDLISKEFPQVRIILGNGSLFWNRAMCIAFAEALKENFDYYIWINDDIIIYPDAFKRMFACAEATHNQAIIVGSLFDPEQRKVSYGGVKRCSKWHPFKYSLIKPSDSLTEVHTMNGNLVLIPATIAQKVGNLDKQFTHGIGDFDYGLRARQLGYNVILAPQYYGTCSKNSLKDTWADTSLSRKRRWDLVKQPKGLPPKEWRVFSRRHAGRAWPIFYIFPYLRILLGR